MERLTEDFGQAPKQAARDMGGPFGLYFILNQYQELSKKNGYAGAFPGQELLAKEFGVGTRTIRNWLNTLERMGYVTVDRRGKKQVNNYFVHAEPITPLPNTPGDRKDVASHFDEGDRKDCASDRKDVAGVTGKMLPASNTDSNNTDSNNKKGAVAPTRESNEVSINPLTGEPYWADRVGRGVDDFSRSIETKRLDNYAHNNIPLGLRGQYTLHCYPLVSQGYTAEEAIKDYFGSLEETR